DEKTPYDTSSDNFVTGIRPESGRCLSFKRLGKFGWKYESGRCRVQDEITRTTVAGKPDGDHHEAVIISKIDLFSRDLVGESGWRAHCKLTTFDVEKKVEPRQKILTEYAIDMFLQNVVQVVPEDLNIFDYERTDRDSTHFSDRNFLRSSGRLECNPVR